MQFAPVAWYDLRGAELHAPPAFSFPPPRGALLPSRLPPVLSLSRPRAGCAGRWDIEANQPGKRGASQIIYHVSGFTTYQAASGGSSGATSPVSAASAPTVNDDSSDGYAVGQVWIDTTSDVPYMLVDATAGAAVWRLLQLSHGDRIRAYGVAGAAKADYQRYVGGAWTTITGPASPDVTADPQSLGATWNGADVLVPAWSVASPANQMSEAQILGAWKLNATGSLGVVVALGDTSFVVTADHGQNAGSGLGNWYIGGGVFNATYAKGLGAGYGRSGIDGATKGSQVDNGNTTTSTAARGGPCRVLLSCVDGGIAGGMLGNEVAGPAWQQALLAPDGTAIATPYLVMYMTRPHSGVGGSATVTAPEVCLYPMPGGLS